MDSDHTFTDLPHFVSMSGASPGAYSPDSSLPADQGFVTRASQMVEPRSQEIPFTAQTWWKSVSTLDYSPDCLTATEMDFDAERLSPWNSGLSALSDPQSPRSTHSGSLPAMHSYTTPPYLREELAVSAVDNEQVYPAPDSVENSMVPSKPCAYEVGADPRSPYSDSHPTPEQVWPSHMPADSMTGVQPSHHLKARASSASRVQKPTTEQRPTSVPGCSRRRRGAPKGNNSSDARVFICSFARYGCESTFASKNEWKRHTTSQHLQLGFYRCDVGKCSVHFNHANSYDLPSPVTSPQPRTTSPLLGQANDFNRKDLFTQHQRRMHAPWLQSGRRRTPTDAEHAAFEKSLEEVRQRCWHGIRQPPLRSHCGFCGETFLGEGSWDRRMEHVGWHFAHGEGEETEDAALQEWGLREGILILVEGECYLASLHRG